MRTALAVTAGYEVKQSQKPCDCYLYETLRERSTSLHSQ
ncbi:hypothetical protein COO91_07916 [Nostoc flagelliforme CCNUN1]|uniref:Uncharacterized protein n=1 Tax=Nostoc flagelliforme CCNUN1 TaxID=2038116 RepID=A0A2K8T2B2_9NOSO|nr:hypothetical protein COO91_07916 [Nostoc flagelliforme CCNUN1]